MTFITILVGLVLERFIHGLQEWRRHAWFHTLYTWLQQRIGSKGFWNGPVGVVLILFAPIAIIALLTQLLDGVLLGLLMFLFSIAVLLLSLGPRDLDEDVENYLQARESSDASDDSAACTAASAVLGRELNSLDDINSRAMVEAIAVQANERIFAVLFWYAILGPVGAVLFRLTCMLRTETATDDNDLAVATRRLHGILAWLPARITALGFAIAGSFEDAIHNWRNRSAEWSGEWIDSSDGVLAATGTGALQMEIEAAESDQEAELNAIRAGLGLVWRTLIAWVTLFALLTLAGWAG